RPDSALSFASVTVDSGATLSIGGGSTVAVQNALTVTDSSIVVFGGKNTGGQVDGQWHGVGATVSAGDVTIDAGSKLSADGQGYDAQRGPGAGASRKGNKGGGRRGACGRPRGAAA